MVNLFNNQNPNQAIDNKIKEMLEKSQLSKIDFLKEEIENNNVTVTAKLLNEPIDGEEIRFNIQVSNNCPDEIRKKIENVYKI